MSKLLLIEDDPILGRSLSVYLELEGYQVSWVRDLQSAHQHDQTSPCDLVILDINLPDGSGLDFCTALRVRGSRIPVIILTAKIDEDSVVAGFNAGANDYVKKPFGNRELLARIKATLREPMRRDAQLRFGDLLILIDKHQVFGGEKEIELNRREYEILGVLIQNSEAVVTRETLLSHLDKDGDIFDRTVDSHVSHIRSKLKKSGIDSVQITSVYGVGYRLEKKG